MLDPSSNSPPPNQSGFGASPLIGLSQDTLDISRKTRSNGFAWSGQFSPQLVESLLEGYGKEGQVVLDPFVGSGTVLVESGRKQMAAYGVEVNPSAFHLAHFYEAINWDRTRRNRAVAPLAGFFENLNPSGSIELIEEQLRAALLKLLPEVSHDAQILLTSAIILSDFGNKSLTSNRLRNIWSKIVLTLENLPHSSLEVKCFLGDSRAIPLQDRTIDLVITSPPYINVFNYHQQYRKSCESLGWKPLVAAQSEIGANRKFRSNRFNTVTQYCIDMGLVLKELRRVCRGGAHLIMILGRESRVRKTAFANGDILKRLAEECVGFTVELLQERSFRNKFGAHITEDIIHLSLRGEPPLKSSTELAKEVLLASMRQVPDESKKDLEAAIEASSSIDPSLIFDPSLAKRP